MAELDGLQRWDWMKDGLKVGMILVGMMLLASFANVMALADTEPNDDLTTAENASYGSISGTINDTDTEDNYKLSDITTSDVVFVNLTTAPIGTEMTLYDGETGNYIISKTGQGSKYVYCPNEADPQSLIVAISGSTGAYTFTAEKMTQNDGNSGGDAPAERTATLPSLTQGTYNGYLVDYDEQDWYQVNLPANKYIRVDVDPSSTLTAYLQIYMDDSYINSETGSSLGANVSMWYYSDAAASYKVGIQTSGSTYGSYAFTITTWDPNDGGQGTEAGRVAGSELYINGTVNATYPGTFAGEDYEDWYLMNITDGDAVTINAKPIATETIGLAVYKVIGGSSSYDMSDHSNGNGENVTLHACYNTAGTPLQLSLRLDDSVSYGVRNDYNFTVQILHQNDGGSGRDAGETTGTAVDITKGNFTGYVEDEDDVDFYKFNVGAGNTINATFIAPTNMKVTVTLYDASNAEHGTFTLTEGGTNYISYQNSAAAQAYYLKIEQNSYGGADPLPATYFYDIKLDIIGGDSEAPSAYMPALPATSCTNFTVSWNSPDVDASIYTVQVRYGTNDWADWKVNVTTKSAVYPGANNTRFFFRVRACDTSGNWGTFTSNPDGDTSTNVTCEGTSTADTTEPTITITSPTDGATVGIGAINVQGTATDNVGVINVEVRLGSGIWQAATRSGDNWNITLTLSAGSNTITARASDAAGNQKEATITVTSSASGNTAPEAVVLNVPTKVTKSGFTLTWSPSADADFANYEVHISTNASFTPSASTLKTTLSPSTTVTYAVTGLKSGTTFYAKIKVTDTGALSSVSNEVYAKTSSSSGGSSNSLCCGMALAAVIPAAFAVVMAWRKKQE